ncbi:NAD/NADP-dependent indole-3-acetaldehyde [Cyphellophora attinorum]|uniref:D-xylose reductase [NAD(P)H] n=1 Tax=Cyphellophora attinorum TaxID=1664694 RepID=A0A0N0NI36_9EURO|nr:NAD/NADP-dependent indole-3-acetaldehyde [Phialophora attinorum]KPI34989.1 NAD/NADP-dependent indole-3-acetaldehyde [Phialophora attinorum]
MAKLDLTVPDLSLPDGNKIPMLGYGTGTAWYKKDDDPYDKALIEATLTAVKLGYTHLDGAEVYNTEEELGEAISKSKVPREKLFITDKVATNIQDIPSAIDISLKKLGLDYLDLYLIHEPFWAKGDEAELQKKWAQMEDVLASGKVKSIGVSNYLKPDLEAILKTAKVRPAINQIEYHPYLQHGDLITYHKSKDIKLAAYGPQLPVTRFTGGPLDPILESLAKKYAVNPGEILLRWVIDQGIVAVTTSSKEQRLSDYLRIFTFNLTPKEIEQISETGSGYHKRGFWSAKFADDDTS